MNKLTFTLKQHTPLIHFQHDQAGATLRATEVKPKLDKYLLKILGEGNYETGIEKAKAKNWLVGKGEHPALNYKMRFDPVQNTKFFIPLPLSDYPKGKKDMIHKHINQIKSDSGVKTEALYPTPFFANLRDLKSDNSSDLQIGVYTSNEITISLTIWETKLKDCIQKHLNYFFLCNNFGSRQNKGFGSFTVKSIDGEKPNQIDLSKLFLCQSIQKFSNAHSIFEFIKSEYQLLKGGINEGNQYAKPHIYDYFKNNPSPVVWEKAALKGKINELLKYEFQLFSERNMTASDHMGRDDKNKFTRALLGLPGTYSFPIAEKHNPRERLRKPLTITVKHQTRDQNDTIERFASPVFFKVIDGYVYIIAQNTYHKILNKTFKFSIAGSYLKHKGMKELKTPDSFDLRKFLINHLSGNQWTKITES